MSAAPIVVPIDTFYTSDLPGGRIRAIGRNGDGTRIVLLEKANGSAVKVLADFSFGQGLGLAEAVIAGDPTAINRPKGMLELAAFVLGFYAALSNPDLFKAETTSETEPV